MKNLGKIIVACSVAVLLSFFAIAQPTTPPTSPPDPTCQDPNNPFSPPCPIPIDGGVVFLIAAGVAYGGKKVYDLQRKD